MELRAARELSGKTQAQVAKEVGIKEQVYQRYEYGRIKPSVQTAIRIAKVLNASIEKLWGGSPAK